MTFLEIKWFLLKILHYYKGRLYCLYKHAPVIRGLGGYGGIDHLHRSRKAYHSMWCVKCNNRWEQPDHGEPCHASHMWHFRSSERHK